MPQVLHDRYVWMQRLERWSEQLLILGLFLAAAILLVWNGGTLPLRDWDEGTIAQVARDIWRADWTDLRWLYPTLGGVPYFNKPPLIHNFIALAYHLGGVNEWTSRLPGAVLTAASVPMLYGVGREIFVGRSPALLAALIYGTMLPVMRHGRLAMLDGPVLLFFLLLIWCVLRSRRNPRWALGIGLAFGLIGLTKGILALLLGAIALCFLSWDSPRLLTSLYLWLGIGLGATPGIVWYAAQGWYYGSEFIETHMVTQSFSRVWEPVENNTGPPWYYVLELLKYGWPWLMFLPLALKTAWRSRSLSWAKLVLVWSGGYFAVISVMSTKLPWYLLPIYPALALAIAVPLSQLWQRSSLLSDGERPLQPPSWWVGWFALLALVAWGGSIYFGYLLQPQDLGLQLTMMAFGLTMTVCSVLTHRGDRQFMSVLIWGTYVSLLIFVSTPHWLWELAEDYPVRPVAALVSQVPADAEILTSHHGRPSLNFYSDRQVIPAGASRIERQWQRSPGTYFLLDAAAMTQLDLTEADVVGTSEGWTLLRRLPPRPLRGVESAAGMRDRISG
jgi:4-amino-4-deoxy-L-arabinose transferase-like glycosyltransferase